MSSAAAADLQEALGWRHERVTLVHDEASGLQAVIAIHSTALGPALGGMRTRRYERGVAGALDDALRLSRAMTLKASAAGLDLGGGKAVVVDDGRADLREQRLVAMAREIDRLGGTYITAEDVGTSTADMDLVAEHTDHVAGCSERDGVGGDPSPATARTVLDAIRAALAATDGDPALSGRTVGVVGLGKVGGQLAEWLLAEGAQVVGFDPVEATRRRMAAIGVELAGDPGAVLAHQLDVLAPCALGGLVDARVARDLSCRIVCGAANNPLTGEAAAEALAARGILYVPDFLANCGGLVHADAERRGDGDPQRLQTALAAAHRRIADVLEEARETRRLPSVVAEEHAWARIARAQTGATADVAA